MEGGCGIGRPPPPRQTVLPDKLLSFPLFSASFQDFKVYSRILIFRLSSQTAFPESLPLKLEPQTSQASSTDALSPCADPVSLPPRFAALWPDLR